MLRPVILLPKKTDWTDEEALRYVLEHEFVHIRRFDSVGKLLLIAAACVHWFNPLVWAMYVPVSYTHLDVYKRQPLHTGAFGRTGSSAPTFKVDGAAGRNGEEFMQTLQMVLYFRALKC